MRRSKNNSSVCQTTTLITLSDISLEQSQPASLSSNCQQHLINKARELEGILAATRSEQIMLKNNQQLLLQALAEKKQLVSNSNYSNIDEFSEPATDDFARTCKINYRSPRNKEEYKNSRQSKNHKFYSAIQSPLRISPEQGFNSYGKSRYCPQSTLSKATGTIRKQHRQGASQLYSVCEDYKSIEDIWNESGNDSKKYLKQKSIRSFL